MNAWIAGSELERDEDFTGPAIGILGATQLNGGAVGTLIVLGCVALLLRTAYEYFRAHAEIPWVQFWWSITFYNSWFMVVGDDPMIWFYYNWGFTTFPIVIVVWLANQVLAERSPAGRNGRGVNRRPRAALEELIASEGISDEYNLVST